MRINKQDYRLTYAEDFSTLESDLSNLKLKITKNHPRITNFYLNLKKANYKVELVSAFKYRCCYCGCSLYQPLVEIDHIYSPTSEKINTFENLAPSCCGCNNLKSNIVDNVAFANKINPITNIFNCFIRNEDLSISISPAFISDNDIILFYNKLRLGSEIKRLDFLLICLQELSSRIKDKIVRNEVINIKNEIAEKRKHIFVD